MPSEPTITQELLNQAANELAAAGRKPTLELVRTRLAELTGTKGGSYATLSPWLRAWKEAERSATVEPVREVPPAVAERVAALAADLWAAASDVASARLAGEREALHKARAEAEAETAEALELAERMTEERDVSAAALVGSNAQLDALRAELVSSMATAEANLGHAVAESQALSDALRQRSQDLDGVRTKLATSEEALRASQRQAEASAADAAQKTRLLDQLDRDFARIQVEHRTAVEQGANAQAEIERLRAELAASQERERTTAQLAAAAAADAARAVATAEAGAVRASDQLREQKTRSAEVITKLEAAKHDLEKEREALQREQRAMAQALGKAGGELEALRTQVGSNAELIKSLSQGRPAAGGGTKSKGD